MNAYLPSDYTWIQNRLNQEFNSGVYKKMKKEGVGANCEYYQNRNEPFYIIVERNNTGIAAFTVGTLHGSDVAGLPAFTYSVCDTEQDGNFVDKDSCAVTRSGHNGSKSTFLSIDVCKEEPLL